MFCRIPSVRRSDMGQKAENEKETVDGGKKKKEEVSSVVVLEVYVDSDPSASKIKRRVEGFQGVNEIMVEKATIQLRVTGNVQLRVTGNVDPCKLRDYVKYKTGKEVHIISPVNPPKEIDGGDKKQATADVAAAAAADFAAAAIDAAAAAFAAAATAKAAAAAGRAWKDEKKSEEVASTVVLQILHCDCSTEKIKEIILKAKGVQEVNMDDDLVTVKGTVGVNSLTEYLEDKLKHDFKIICTGGDY